MCCGGFLKQNKLLRRKFQKTVKNIKKIKNVPKQPDAFFACVNPLSQKLYRFVATDVLR